MTVDSPGFWNHALYDPHPISCHTALSRWTHMNVCTRTHSHTHTHTHARTHTHTHSLITLVCITHKAHTRPHTHTLSHTHTYTHTHTLTDTHYSCLNYSQSKRT